MSTRVVRYSHDKESSQLPYQPAWLKAVSSASTSVRAAYSSIRIPKQRLQPTMCELFGLNKLVSGNMPVALTIIESDTPINQTSNLNVEFPAPASLYFSHLQFGLG